MKKIFTLFLLQASLSAISQTSYYVNDVYISTDDIFTTSDGNDLNTGTAASPFATIAKAYQTAVAGDIIYVDAGTYNNVANGSVAKSLTFRGANYLISPNDPIDPLMPNGGRNAETIITNTLFTIAASNVTFSGFLFNPGINIQFDQNNTGLDYDNITISKNIFRNTSGNAPIRLRGKNNTPLVSFNYSVLDNRFIKEVNIGGTSVVISGVDGVQIQNNTFTVSTDIANRTESDIAINATFRSDNVVISQNIAYRQNNLVSAVTALHARIDFNKAIECNRFSNASNSLSDPCIVDISDNIVTDPKGGASSIAYQRNNGFNLTSPNIARIERNTVTVNGTGLSSIPAALISAGLNDNTQNSQVYIRDNKLSYSGSFSSLSNPSAFISGINFLNNSRQAVVERNEIEFNADNYNTNNKNGIYILHFNLQPGANFDILNNKVSGFPTSFAIQQNIPSSTTEVGPFGQLPDWATVNAHNNSFTSDVLSINNGTLSETVNASCNWYGSAASQDIINKITLGTLDLIPWLTNGTDNEPATGFQPVPGACDNGYPPLIVLDNYTNVTCNAANNGTINITASYGNAPFAFTWTKDGDATFVSHDEDPTNLSPGTYHLAVVDANGSTIYITDQEADGPGTIDVTITEPATLTANATGSNANCFNGNDGTAAVSAGGGTENYSYLWSNNETTASINNLVAGIYSVTITDANGCTAQSGYEVTQPPLLTASVQVINNICYNGTAGIITVDPVSGGSPGYEYSLNGTDYQPDNVFSNLAANNYTVYVRDSHGCVTTVAALVTQPTAIVVSIANITNSCSGTSSGAITINVTGGTGAYSYIWTGPNGFTKNSKNLTNLAAGTYNLTVSDANGCTAMAQAVISVLPAITIGGSITSVSCFGTSTGAVNITAGGGSGAFIYTWSGPNGYKATTEDISNVKAGSYSVTVKDAAGCSFFQSFTVNQPAPLSVSATPSIINVCGGSGSIAVSVSGGTEPYQYKLNNGSFQQSNTFNGLTAGPYSITVQDANGCQAIASASIADNGSDLYEPNDNISPSLFSLQLNQPVQARIAPSKNDKDYFLFTTGAIPASYTLSLTNSPANYTFAIYDNKGKAIVPSSSTATTKTYNSLATNTAYYPGVTGTSWSMLCYTLAISNSVAATIVNKATRIESMEIVIDKLNTSVFPNPHHGSFGIKIESAQDGTAIVEILNSLGQMISAKRIAVNKGGVNIVNFTGMHQTILFYRVSIGNEMKTGKIIGPN